VVTATNRCGLGRTCYPQIINNPNSAKNNRSVLSGIEQQGVNRSAAALHFGYNI